MRTAIRSLAAILGLALVACSSGGITVVRPVPAPAPVVYVEPLEVDIARPHQGKLFVQTNRAAYVAIFEIIPEHGVELVYPVSSRERRFVVAGLRDVPIWWEPTRVTYHAGWSTSRAYPGRYIYTIASDEPLRIPDAAYRSGYLRDVLGAREYSSANPYVTMRALAREFVPAVRDEEWAEDTYVVSPSYATERYSVTRVYCRGTMYEVPSEFADRVWCPTYGSGGPNGRGRVTEVDMPGSRRPLVRPDSVVGDNGRKVAIRPRGPNGRGPIDRVKEPAGPEHRGSDRAANDDDDRPRNGPVKQRPGVGPGNVRPVVPNERTDDPPPRVRGKERGDDRDSAKPGANNEPKRADKSEPKPDSSGAVRPQNSDETKGESEKGRGGREAKDEKSRGSNGRGPIDRVKEPAGPEQRGSDPAANDDRPGNGPVKQRAGDGPGNVRLAMPNDRTDDPPPRARGAEVVDDRGAAKPDSNSEPKPADKTESKPDSSGGAKPQTSGETKGESKKGRGRGEAKDEKSDDKSKQPREPKPLG